MTQLLLHLLLGEAQAAYKSHGEAPPLSDPRGGLYLGDHLRYWKMHVSYIIQECVPPWKTRKSLLNLEIRKLRDPASQCLRQTSQSFLLWDTAGWIWDLNSQWQTLCNFPLSWVSEALITSPILNSIIFPSECLVPPLEVKVKWMLDFWVPCCIANADC